MNLLPIIIVLALLPAGFASQKQTVTSEQQAANHIEELKQKIAKDSDRDVCIHSAELIHDLVEQFNSQMNAGQLEPAQRTLNDISTYADKARDAAKGKHHRVKKAELMLHQSSRRLADIAQSLALENRPAINEVIKHIEAADDELLNQVFKD